MDVALRGVSPSPDGDPVGDPVDPVTQEIAVADRCRAADQHEKRCLECILDVVLVVENAAANTQDHSPMPGDQSGKCHLVALGGEPFQELVVVHAHDGPLVEDAIQLAQDNPRVAAHDDVPRNVFGPFTPDSASRAISNLPFFEIPPRFGGPGV